LIQTRIKSLWNTGEIGVLLAIFIMRCGSKSAISSADEIETNGEISILIPHDFRTVKKASKPDFSLESRDDPDCNLLFGPRHTFTANDSSDRLKAVEARWPNLLKQIKEYEAVTMAERPIYERFGKINAYWVRVSATDDHGGILAREGYVYDNMYFLHLRVQISGRSAAAQKARVEEILRTLQMKNHP
jgi:hypothetical protein